MYEMHNALLGVAECGLPDIQNEIKLKCFV